MLKQIDVYFKNVYGNTVCYPHCYEAKIFASISGHKTLTDATLEGIKELGYSVRVYRNPEETNIFNGKGKPKGLQYSHDIKTAHTVNYDF